MRIGIICPYSVTTPGGVQGQVLGLARSLRRLGHPARVLAPCDGPPPDAHVTPLGNSLPYAVNGSVAPLAPDPSAQLRLIRALRDEDFDVLHIHEPMAPGPTQTAMLVKTAPMVGTFHAAGEIAAYKWFAPGVKWLAGRLDRRCAVSADAEAMARRFLAGDYVRLFNGVELDRYEGGQPAPTDAPTIFFLGRHEPRKGLAVLLEAMSELPSNVRLWVGSDGPETAELQQRHAGDPRIEWLGRLSEADKVAHLRGADVVCFPSLSGESFGVVLLEGMAAGTPIVATRLPGYSNVARAGEDALLVEPGDAHALAEAISQVLDDPALAASLVASGHERAAHFSMDRLAEQYLEIFEQLVVART